MGEKSASPAKSAGQEISRYVLKLGNSRPRRVINQDAKLDGFKPSKTFDEDEIEAVCFGGLVSDS